MWGGNYSRVDGSTGRGVIGWFIARVIKAGHNVNGPRPLRIPGSSVAVMQTRLIYIHVGSQETAETERRIHGKIYHGIGKTYDMR